MPPETCTENNRWSINQNKHESHKHPSAMSDKRIGVRCQQYKSVLDINILAITNGKAGTRVKPRVKPRIKNEQFKGKIL